MRNIKMFVIALVLSIVGFISLYNFESMAYWGEDTMVWFWLGALFTFFCIFGSLLFIYFSIRKEKFIQVKFVPQLAVTSFFIYTFLWTSLVVYVWYFKDFSF